MSFAVSSSPASAPASHRYAAAGGLSLSLGGHLVQRQGTGTGSGKPVVLYAVVASAAPSAFSPTPCEIDRRWKRYSDFDRLASGLQPAQKLLQLPPLPPKEWSVLTPPDSEALIQKRCVGLAAWLNALATALNTDWTPPFVRRLALEWLAQGVEEGGKQTQEAGGAASQSAAQPQPDPAMQQLLSQYAGQLHMLGVTTLAPVAQTAAGDGSSVSMAQINARKQAEAAADQQYFSSLTAEQRAAHLRGLELLCRLSSQLGWAFVSGATSEWWQFDLRNRLVERRFGSPGASKHSRPYRFAAPPRIRLEENIVEIELSGSGTDRALLRMTAPEPAKAADAGTNELLQAAAPPQQRTLTIRFVGCGLYFLGLSGATALDRPLTPDEQQCVQREENERTYVEADVPQPLVIHFTHH